MFMKEFFFLCLLAISLLISCTPSEPTDPIAPAPIVGTIIPVGEPEIRDLSPTTEVVANCGAGGGTVIKHPSRTVLTNHSMVNNQGFSFIDLFAGIGGIRLAFESAGGTCVFASEWDKDAQKTYAANFGHVPYGDITKIPSSQIPEHDILTGGFPCQPFSIIGQGLGFTDTRGTLFFEIERILHDKQPHALLLENVKQLKSHDQGRTFEIILNTLRSLGYYIHDTVLDARDFGLPQKRERAFIVGFKKNYRFVFPSRPIDGKYLTLADILEPDEDIDSKYFASDYILQKRAESVENKKIFYPSIWHENKGGNIGINSFSCALRAGASFNYLLVNGKRRLTPREQLRLQGFPDTFKILGTETKIRRQTGNSVPVKVVEAIAHQMIAAIRSGIVIEEQDNIIYKQPALF